MAKYHTKNEVDNLMIEESAEDNTDIITTIDLTDEWARFRLDLATYMFNTW